LLLGQPAVLLFVPGYDFFSRLHRCFRHIPHLRLDNQRVRNFGAVFYDAMILFSVLFFVAQRARARVDKVKEMTYTSF
jgi:hypothetical protein